MFFTILVSKSTPFASSSLTTGSAESSLTSLRDAFVSFRVSNSVRRVSLSGSPLRSLKVFVSLSRSFLSAFLETLSSVCSMSVPSKPMVSLR